MIRRLIQSILAGCLLLLLVALWRSDALPQGSSLDPELLEEPVQTQLQQATFQIVTNGVTYTVQPLFDYDLTGLVVSKHDADTWWDYIHRAWNDHLNVVDLCVVWGNNVRSGAYADIDFSSGQFTCNFSTRSAQAFAAFDLSAISNNHLLTDDAGLARRMRSVRVGDQIHFRGRLAEYSHHQGFAFKRGTSTVRTDTGNGACETVFVDSFDILQTGGGPWRMLARIAGVLLLLGVIAWFAQPPQFRD